ncbi:MAG: hypothetical protein WBO98_09370 [Candidatus Nitrotoga sp.]
MQFKIAVVGKLAAWRYSFVTLLEYGLPAAVLRGKLQCSEK